MSDELHIKAIIDEVDDSKLQQSLAKTQSNTGKALSSGSNSPQTAIGTSLLQANKLQDRFKLLSDAQKQLAAQPGMERQLAKVNQELAGQYGHQKRIATTVDDYIKNLEKEVVLRKQARDLMNNSEGGSNQYSAHSQRQMAFLQQNLQRVTGALPGGGIINQFASGASRGAAGAESGAGAIGMGALGGGLAAGFAAAAAGAAALVSTMGQLASRSKELAQMGSSGPSGLGALKNTLEQNSIRGDIVAASPASVGLAKAISDWGAGAKDLLGHAFNNSKERNQALGDRLDQGLGGVNGEQWLVIKQQRSDMEQDLTLQKQALDVGTFRKQRDFQIQLKNFQVDTTRQYEDLNKQKQRSEWDFTLAKTQFEDNHAGVMAQKQFQASQQFAMQGYQVQTRNTLQDFSLAKTYKEQDFGINKARSTAEFNLNKSYALEDRKDSLQDAILGGANGLQLMQMNRDFNKAQTRQKTQFDISQKYAGQDLSLSESRDKTALGIGLGRNAEQFKMSQQQAQVGRQFQIEDELYNRKFQGIQLEEQHNRTIFDLNQQYTRLGQNVARDKQALGNQAGDLQYDTNMAYFQNDLQAFRARRNQSDTESGFAGAVRASDPLGAVGQGMKDASFAQALARNASRTGQQDLFGQFNAANSKTSTGGQIGDIINRGGAANAQSIIDGIGNIGTMIGLLGEINQIKSKSVSGSFGTSSDWGSAGQGQPAPLNVNFYAGNPTFPAVPGVSQADLDYYDKRWQDGIKSLSEEIQMQMIARYGG